MKNRKSIIALLLIAIIGIVGLTIAYFANSTDVENTFITKEYGTTYEETFVSPENWLPGDTTPKTLVATNTGEVDQAVRVLVTESWTTDNDGTLNGWIHSDGTKSTHTTQSELETDERVAILNLANTSDWTKVGNYYYYNYKLAPGEDTTSFLESVTFNSKTKLDDTCTTSTSNGVTTTTCNSSGDDYDNATYTLTFTIETVQYNKYATAWNTGSSVTIANSSRPINIQEFVANKTNDEEADYDNGNTEKMFVFKHNTINETRYIGSNPKNYVKFNCDNDGSNCEIWRIIGTFNVERPDPNNNSQTITEQRIKLVRGYEFATTMAWDSNNSNDWTNASLMIFLNGDYYNKTGAAADYGLKSSAKNMIDDAIFYLGASAYDETNHYGSAEDIYSFERGNTLCGACGTDTSKSKWTGKVALMYPSDMYMVYGKGVNDNCYNDPYLCRVDETPSGIPSTGWIYNSNIPQGSSSRSVTWLLSPGSGDTKLAFLTYIDGFLRNYGSNVESLNGIRPVVYLKANVKIAGGNGELGNEYILE